VVAALAHPVEALMVEGITRMLGKWLAMEKQNSMGFVVEKQ